MKDGLLCVCKCVCTIAEGNIIPHSTLNDLRPYLKPKSGDNRNMRPFVSHKYSLIRIFRGYLQPKFEGLKQSQDFDSDCSVVVPSLLFVFNVFSIFQFPIISFQLYDWFKASLPSDSNFQICSIIAAKNELTINYILHNLQLLQIWFYL